MGTGGLRDYSLPSFVIRLAPIARFVAAARPGTCWHPNSYYAIENIIGFSSFSNYIGRTLLLQLLDVGHRSN
jgi:hypothetical protein